MVKRGQVSIFIILAIIIVIAIVIAIIIRLNFFPNNQVHPEVQPIHDFIDNCLEETGEYGVYFIGQTGGYFITPELSIDDGTAIYFDQENYMPSKELIESELSNYIEGMIDLCIDNYKDFPDFEISGQEKTVKTVIEDTRVISELTYQVTISKAEKTYNIEKFQAEIPVRLGIIYKAIKEFTDDQITHPEEVCVTCITRIAEEKDLYFRMLDYDERTVLFNIRDKNSKILGEEYVFKFANRY